MISNLLKDFNQVRKGGYKKDEQKEIFLERMNLLLQAEERARYQDYGIDHPFIFIFGLPRSGTTLISQVLSHCVDCGYINNLIARFWLAPVHGIWLSRSLLGDTKYTSFQSDYARTTELNDIHEFGYFWRNLLNKNSMSDITRSAELEDTIDWAMVRKTLANMQHAFAKPMVFKNIFGAYHLARMKQVLAKIIYVYIQRDPLDVAVSILDARRKYYRNPNTWWSYTPVEYDQLKGLDYWEQIAGQVYFLNRYYQRGIDSGCQEFTVTVRYEELCRNPGAVLENIRNCTQDNYGYDLRIADQVPGTFSFRTYTDRDEEKAKFEALIEQFRQANE